MKHISILLTSTLIFTACGSSNPGNPNPVVTVPGFDNKPQRQGEAQTQLSKDGAFAVTVDGLDGNRVLNLKAGVKGTAVIRVTSVNDSIPDLELSNLNGALPVGATLNRTNKYTWTFSWAPPVTYPKSKVEMSFNLHAVDSSSQFEAMKSVGQNISFQIAISDTVQKPIFKGISADFTKGYQEGDIVPFFVDVQDPSAAQTNQAPDIRPSAASQLSNRELAPIDGTKLIQPDPAHPQIEKMGPGLYRAYFIFDTSKNLPWPKGNDNSALNVKACFDIVAKDLASKQQMEPVDFCPVITYAASTPTIKWDAGAIFLLKSGMPAATLNLTIHTEGTRGAIDFKNASKNFEKWPGNPTFTCDPQAGLERKCHIAWTPGCVAKSTNFSFSVKSTASFQGINRSAPREGTLPAQILTVEPDLVNCPMPVKPVTAPKAPPVKKAVAPKKDAAPARPVAKAKPVQKAKVPQKIATSVAKKGA